MASIGAIAQAPDCGYVWNIAAVIIYRKFPEIKLLQCPFCHYKYHMDYTGIEPAIISWPITSWHLHIYIYKSETG
jgi:hypothetical protein